MGARDLALDEKPQRTCAVVSIAGIETLHLKEMQEGPPQRSCRGKLGAGEVFVRELRSVAGGLSQGVVTGWRTREKRTAGRRSRMAGWSGAPRLDFTAGTWFTFIYSECCVTQGIHVTP